MSTPSPARDHGVVDMDNDDDHLDLGPDQAHSDSDEETVKGQEHIAEILEEERQQEDAEPTSNTSNPLGNRYRQLLRERDDLSEEVSEGGSAEGLPRRVGSPIGSLQSIPDDTPSIQVGSNVNLLLGFRPLIKLILLGLNAILSWQQCPSLLSIATRS